VGSVPDSAKVRMKAAAAPAAVSTQRHLAFGQDKDPESADREFDTQVR
jgi:hypothetical protein